MTTTIPRETAENIAATLHASRPDLARVITDAITDADHHAAPTFDGLAFPVAKVRYSNGHYNATIRWDSEHTFRARVSMDYRIGAGARNAVRAALAAHEKLTAAFPGLGDESPIPVPGDLDADSYSFTFVPARFFK